MIVVKKLSTKSRRDDITQNAKCTPQQNPVGMTLFYPRRDGSVLLFRYFY